MNKFTSALFINLCTVASSVCAANLTPVASPYISPLYDDNGHIKSAIPKSIYFESQELYEGKYIISDEESLLESSTVYWQPEDSYWTITSGQTDNTKSGPISGKWGWDNYVYFDTGPGQASNKGDSAYFYLPTNYDINDFYLGEIQDAYITFDYHMFGKDTGHLIVEAYDIEKKQWVEVWTRGGQKQRFPSDDWTSEYVSLADVKTNGNVRIKAVANGGLNGEIAFDNYYLSSHAIDKHVHITDMYIDYYDGNYNINWVREYGEHFYTVSYMAQNINSLEEKVIVEDVFLSPYNVGYVSFSFDEMCDKLGAGEWEIGFQVWLKDLPSSAAQIPEEFNYHFNCDL